MADTATIDAAEPASPPANQRSIRGTFENLTARVSAASAEAWTTFAVVVGSALFVFWQLRPDLLLADTTPSGGDMGAHVWGPAFIRDHLLPDFRITGWTPDWYAGFPAFQFYMVVPALGVVALSYLLPYGVAFKLVTVLGVVTLPVAAWALGRLARLAFPAPALMSVVMLSFLFDQHYWIWGGNVPSMLAGEFAYSISLSLAVLYLGVLIRGLQTGRHRVLAAVLLALVGLCHIIPAIFAVGATAVTLVFLRGVRQLKWLLVALPLAAMLAAFWLLPFWWRRQYVNDMGWDKLDAYWENLARSDLTWVIVLAVSGLVLSLIRSLWFGRALSTMIVLLAVAVRYAPDWRLWNARLLPFYYLCLFLLAAYALASLIRVALGRGTAEAEVLKPPGRLSLVAGAAVPTVAAVLLADDLLLDGWITRNLMEAMLGFGVAEAERVQGQVAGLAEVVLIGALLVGAVEIVSRLRFELRASIPRGIPRWGTIAGGVMAGLMVLIGVALPLRALGPFGATAGDEYGVALGNTMLVGTTGRSFVPTWTAWNYSGYERKAPNASGGGYPEYRDVVTSMAALGETNGCGRAMWEYDKERLDSYGTPMSLMLLPHWTDGCIGSMEGLYFESSVTVPYHFINQSELSIAPSRAMRDLPYPGFDVAAGVEHLQLFGVRYYMAVSEAAIGDARRNPDLTELVTSGPWVVFEVDDSALVVPLEFEPVVVEGSAETPDSWLEASVDPYISDPEGSVLIAAGGPDHWARAASAAEVAPEPVAPVTVSNISVGTSSIGFQVDQIGSPVLVKASYFPNWSVEGADGPYRVAPNLMVVIPTSTDVELTYGWTAVDNVAYVLTGIGIIVSILLLWRPRAIAWGLPDPPTGPDGAEQAHRGAGWGA